MQSPVLTGQTLWSRFKQSKLRTRLQRIAFELAISCFRFAVSASFVLVIYGLVCLLELNELKLLGFLPISYFMHLCILVFALRFVWTALRFAE